MASPRKDWGTIAEDQVVAFGSARARRITLEADDALGVYLDGATEIDVTEVPVVVYTLADTLTAPTAPSGAIALTEDAEDGSLDAGKWASTASAGASVAETGGHLVCNPGNGASVREAYIESQSAFDWTDKYAAVEVVDTISHIQGAKQWFRVHDGVSYAGFTIVAESVDRSQLMLRLDADGMPEDEIAFDLPLMRVLRLRVFEGSLCFDTSPEGETWTTRWEYPTDNFDVNLTAGKLRLGAETEGITSSDPGDAKWDNVNLTVPEYPQVTADIEIFPGDDVSALVATATTGQTVFFHANSDGTDAVYLESAEITPVADDVVFTSHRPIQTRYTGDSDFQTYGAPTIVVYSLQCKAAITTTAARLFAFTGRSGLTVERLDLSGAAYAGTGNTTGRGIEGGSDITVRWCNINNNDSQGMGGNFDGTVTDSDFNNNGAFGGTGSSSNRAALKSTNEWYGYRLYIHDNDHSGVWWDCDNSGGGLYQSVVAGNVGTGIFYEISRGAFELEDVWVQGNNSGNIAGRGGVILTSSKNWTLTRVFTKDNLRQNIKMWEDGRFLNGAGGCSSGYPLQGGLITESRRVSGVTWKLDYDGTSTQSITADDDYPNPLAGSHALCPAGSKVTTLDCNY